MNALKSLNSAQLEQIASAVQDAELKTGAEIVCAVTTESGRYDRAESIFGGLGAILGLA